MQGWGCQQGVLTELGELLNEKEGEGEGDHPHHLLKVAIADGRDQLPGLGSEQGPRSHEHEHAEPAGDQPPAIGLQEGNQPAEASR